MTLFVSLFLKIPFQFIVTKYKSYTGDTKVNIPLDNPVATQYIRFLPKEPGIEQNNADPICMRIQISGCERGMIIQKTFLNFSVSMNKIDHVQYNIMDTLLG